MQLLTLPVVSPHYPHNLQKRYTCNIDQIISIIPCRFGKANPKSTEDGDIIELPDEQLAALEAEAGRVFSKIQFVGDIFVVAPFKAEWIVDRLAAIVKSKDSFHIWSVVQ